MKKRDYNKLALEILDNIGLVENVKQLTHCATRLRFVLSDESLANDTQIKSIDGVVGLVKNAGQYQVIIGNDVDDVYNELTTLLEHGNVESTTIHTKKIKKIDIIAFLTGCFAPVLPVICGAGMIQALLAICAAFGMDMQGSTYLVLNSIANAGFYFLPIFIAYTTAEYLKCNKYLAVMLAGVLLHPALLKVEGLSFIGMQITPIDYSSSVIPIVLGVLFMAGVEKIAVKITPNIVRFFLVPVICIMITAPIMLLFLGPLGGFIGNYLATILTFIGERGSWVATAIIGGLAPLMVMTGMHHAMMPFGMSQFSTLGYEWLMFPGMLAANAAQGGAALAVFFKSKNKKMKATASSTSFMAVLGITEPALYGVNLKLKKPFLCVMIGGVVGGLFAGLMGLKCYAFASAGLASLAIFLGPDGYTNILVALATIIISFIVAFVMVLIIGYDEELED